MAAGLVASGLGLLGRVLFGGGLRTMFTLGSAGYVANELTDGAVADEARERIIDPALDGLYGQVDDGLANLLYENLFANFTDRATFDEYWEQIDPTALGATFGAMKAADIALDRVLGIDLVSTRTVAMAAIGYHLVTKMGLVGQAKEFLEENGFVDLAAIIPSGETAPRQDERGFGEAAARPAAPTVDAPTADRDLQLDEPGR